MSGSAQHDPAIHAPLKPIIATERQSALRLIGADVPGVHAARLGDGWKISDARLPGVARFVSGCAIGIDVLAAESKRDWMGYLPALPWHDWLIADVANAMMLFEKRDALTRGKLDATHY